MAVLVLSGKKSARDRNGIQNEKSIEIHLGFPFFLVLD